VVEEAGVREQRARKLTAGLTLLVVIGMALYSQLSIAAVMQKLVKGLRLLWADWEYPVATASAITQCQERNKKSTDSRLNLSLVSRSNCPPGFFKRPGGAGTFQWCYTD
jgi:hypothetical protein